jgi:prephenate dehydratase
VLVEGVEDDAANFTRFLLVQAGTPGSTPHGVHKLSLCCQVPNRRGALAALLAEVAALGADVTKLQSRPVHGRPWHYHFFVDALMPDARATERLLDRLPGLGVTHKVLGQFQPAPEFA